MSNGTIIDPLVRVAEFHRTFKHPVLPHPQIAPPDRAKLRVTLLQEELDELKDSIAAGSIVGVADALCDLQYVLSGAVLEFGLEAVFYKLFCEVHRSNMSKACLTEEEAQATVALQPDRYTYVKEGDLYLVYRHEDGKTVKSINYSPADLHGIIVAYLEQVNPLHNASEKQQDESPGTEGRRDIEVQDEAEQQTV